MSTPVKTVAITHYHLRRGGVTRVIEHACTSLAQHNIKTVVLTGEGGGDRQAIEATGASVAVVDGLGYDTESGPSVSSDELANRFVAAAVDSLGGEPDLFHIHNHSLGKNAALPGAVTSLANQGRALVLQPHDFAEDGRPANYSHLVRHAASDDAGLLTSVMYPQGGRVRYAVLNGRDAALLLEAGMQPDRVSVLANAVSFGDEVHGDDKRVNAKRGGVPPRYIYPTRAIRRKNIGEMLLWAAVANNEARFAATLAPENPQQRPAYDGWVALSDRLRLPVDYELGRTSDLPFIELLQSAEALLTTSVAEGFGLAFLEPWLIGQRLVGRNLPDITSDFISHGVDLSSLYTRLEVPLEWVGEGSLRERIGAELAVAYAAYGRVCGDDETDRALRAAVGGEGGGEMVDFGRLDEAMQSVVIERVSGSAADRRLLEPEWIGGAVEPGTIERNGKIVREEFGLSGYAKRLLGLYEDATSGGGGSVEMLDAGLVLDRFLVPERFMLLRT